MGSAQWRPPTAFGQVWVIAVSFGLVGQVRSAWATGSSQCGQEPPGPIRRVKRLQSGQPHRTYAAVRLRADHRLRLRSLQSSQQYELELDDVRAGNPAGWGGYAAEGPW